MDQDGVGAGAMVGLGALDRLGQAPAGDQRLDARDEHEVRVGLAVLARLDLAAEFVDVGERLQLGAQEGVRLGELLVLDGDARDTDLLELAHQPTHVVEVAVAGVAVEQQRNRRPFRHEGDVVDDLRPGQLVVVAHAERRRDREAAAPDALETRLLDDARREAAVRLHQEGDLGPGDQPLEHGRPSFVHWVCPSSRLVRNRSRISAGLYGMRGTSASSAVVFTRTKCGPSVTRAVRTAASTSAAVVTARTAA